MHRSRSTPILTKIKQLFPSDLVSVHSVTSLKNTNVLFPEEHSHIKNAVDKRVREFATGRYCARKALGRFGVKPQGIGRNKNGCPMWPKSFVGSISHTYGCVTAVVAIEHKVIALGVDVETIDHQIKDEFWRYICNEEERSKLQELPIKQRRVNAFALFSAKESVIKSCYGLWGSSPRMQEINIRLAIENGSFISEHPGVDKNHSYHWIGSVGISEGYVYTGMWISK